ncbi:hypothetical protein DFH06DRAFT_125311 [Mycena polygramma]|nr:hypothetical protein DFH06DRAFT_125311 [Mycena polygramma]
MSDPDQCALGPDGKLLDAKDITFFNDPDDMVPLPPASSTSTATTITDFFGTAAPPRRSTRAPVPSTRTTDPNNSETTKRKPATALPHPRASARRRSGVESEDADAAQDTEPEDDVDMADATASNSSQHNDSGDDDGEEDPMTEYLKTKAFGEADLEGMQRRKKASATDDVKLMYTADTVDDPHTGKSMTGHWCKLCKIAKRSFKEAFFTGSVSSQRAHIRRNIDHYEVYHRLCEKNKIPEHHAAIPDDTKGIEKQGTLDGFATQTPRIPAFTREGLLDYICELIVTEDGAFRLVDKKPFRVLLQYCRPSLADKDIPHRTMVRDEIEDRARLVIHRVREKLKVEIP